MEAPVDALRRMMRDRKRRRVDPEEEEEEPEFLTRFSPEVQYQIVETLEGAHAGVAPAASAKFVEAARALREIYRAWIARRRVKIERPPDAFTLALARLFVSPRWKLITHMRWPVVRQMLEAYSSAEVPEASRLLVIMSGKRGGWVTATFDPRVQAFESATVAVDRVGGLEFAEIETSFDAASDGGTEIVVKGDASTLIGGGGGVARAIVYGLISPVLDEIAYAHGTAIGWSVASMRSAFFGFSNADFGEPMLAWKDKVAILLVTGYPYTRLDPLIARVTLSGGEFEITHDVQLPEWERDKIGETVDSAVRSAFEGAEHGWTYVRTEIDWFNGASMIVHDDVDGYAIDEARDGDALREVFESAKEPDLESLYPDAGNGWGYEMSMYMPAHRDDTPIGGVLIMPLPWFFFKTRGGGWSTTGAYNTFFARMRFGWNVGKIQIANLGSDNPLNYASHELVWLPDEISDPELEALTMLQRRDIPERATAAAPDVEPL